MKTCVAGLAFLAALVSSAPVSEDETKQVDVLMPKVQPKKKDTYLCYGKKVTGDVFITGFVPHAHMQTAHHMLVFGCTAPGRREQVWNCGEMQSTGEDGTQYKVGSPCEGGMKILYAWGSDAPQLDLPEGVGFKVGPSTDVKYVVLQVHYKNVDKFLPPKNEKDESGVSLNYTTKEQPKLAGVYMMGTGGELPPHSIEYFEAACAITENKVLHPFAFRVHAHTHGVVNAAYRVRDKEWKLIGKQSPQKPQMFYDVADKNMKIKKGDVIAMRCTMENKGNTTVQIGATQNDEMCNFYIMYYVENGKLLNDETCWSAGPPESFFKDLLGLKAHGVPKGASMAPGSNKFLEKTHKQTKIGRKPQLDTDDDDQVTLMLVDELIKMFAEKERQQLVQEAREYSQDGDLGYGQGDEELPLEDERALDDVYSQYYRDQPGYAQENEDAETIY